MGPPVVASSGLGLPHRPFPKEARVACYQAIAKGSLSNMLATENDTSMATKPKMRCHPWAMSLSVAKSLEPPLYP
jgi:hypothetical protein